ncbi:hypothetical protein IW261DRAFT_1568636 [Armillaria novae-zelandiae]|uniref:Uncharacterized protein n=1 Tax=Armillaria novae-zelandiae TaxID=153914 RepID=A0AA39UDF7_9AGAR|nr:hypothetical protein IW261DRAFT_1568636 [Armillaria novae-zelandiae]
MMVHLSNGAHAALESSFKKEPILWDANQCTSYSGRDLVKKVNWIHSAMCRFVLEAKQPWPKDIQAFITMISKNLFDILAKLHLDAWQQWSLALVTAEHILTQYGKCSMLPVHKPSPEHSMSSEDISPSPMPPLKCQKTSASSSKGKGKEMKPVVKMDVQQFGLPVLEFHKQCFQDADDNVATCIIQLQREYETQAATFANIVQALDQIECDHDPDTVLKVTHKYPVSCGLFIEMGYQVGEEYQEIDDMMQAKAMSIPNFARAASIPPITMIVELAPSPIKEEPGLVIPSLLLGSMIEVVPDSDEAIVILDSLAKVDNLLHRASDASSSTSHLMKRPHHA